MAPRHRRRIATLAGVVVLAAVLDVTGVVAALLGFAWLGYDLSDPANDAMIDSVCMGVILAIPLLLSGRIVTLRGRASRIAQERRALERTAL